MKAMICFSGGVLFTLRVMALAQLPAADDDFAVSRPDNKQPRTLDRCEAKAPVLKSTSVVTSTPVADTVSNNRPLDVGSASVRKPLLGEYTRLDQIGTTRPASGIFDHTQGTVATWLKFNKNARRRDHLIFSTDDSRYMLMIDTYHSRGRNIVRGAARAGGNRRAVDSGFAVRKFPEASIVIDNDGSLANTSRNSLWSDPRPYAEREWRHVTMTWFGYPAGNVRIYLDGDLPV